MTRPGLVRNLDQIQEGDRGGSRVGTMLVASLAGACLVFAGVALAHKPAAPPARVIDPLGDLVAKTKAAPASTGSDLAGRDLSFPSMLSDQPRPTTALAAVREEAKPGAAAGAGSALALVTPPPGAPTAPPPAADRLPIVPLPAQSVLGASPVVTSPHDALGQMARDASSPVAEPVAEGRAGGYALQASSFRTEPEAEAFAVALRRRGHHAYVEQAVLPNHGTWYRVRVGPFATQRQATLYRAEFERKERIVPFLVEPPKEKVVVAKRDAAELPRAETKRGARP